MAKFKQLKGVAHNLSDSFVSVKNRDFLGEIESLPIQETKLFKIDILKEKNTLTTPDSKTIKDTIKSYKEWFLKEIKKLKINKEDIESVIIKISYARNEKTTIRGRYYTCNATIKAKGKEYIAKTLSSYA